MTVRIRRRAALASVAALGNPTLERAQAYPMRPIRIVSPFAPGGFNDILSRLVGSKMSERFGQPVVVGNRPGANTIIGSEMVAKSPPDGYTLLMSSLPHVVNPNLYTLPHDPMREFTPIGRITTVPNVLVAHPSLPVHTVAELIAYAKRIPVS